MKKDIRHELTNLERSVGIEKKIEFIWNEFQRLDYNSDSGDRLRSFILCVSTLNSHIKQNCLGESEVKRMVSFAESLLKLEGIKPKTSRLSYLYWELHYITSIVYRYEGKFLLSTWEHELSLHLSPNKNIDQGFTLLSRGEHSMGLGLIRQALKYFNDAQDKSSDHIHKKKIAIYQIRCSRFIHLFEDSESMCRQALKTYHNDERMKAEIQWELACISLMQDGNLAPLISLCRRGKTHYKGGYLLELFYWVHGSLDNRYQKSIARFSTLTRKKELNLSRYGGFYRCAIEIEKAFDVEIPYTIKLQNIKKVIIEYSELFDIDKRGLILLTIIRWLLKSHNKELAQIVFAEYETLSIRVTGGKSGDFL